MIASPRAQDAVAALLEARRTGRALAGFPSPVPATLADAYAIQRALCAALDAPVRGWKVGRIPVDLVEMLGAERLAGPIMRCSDLAGETPGDARVFVGGAAAIEAEVMLRLCAVPAHRLAPGDDAREFVDDFRAGFEVASSPAPDVHAHTPFGIIADIGINNGLLLGPRLDLEDFDRIGVETEIDGAEVGRGRACDVLDGPWGSLRFLVGLHHDGIITLEPGQWISAGAITGVHPIAAGQSASARFGSAVCIACTAVADTGFTP